MPLQRGSGELYSEIESFLFDEIKDHDEGFNPLEQITVEDEYVVYGVNSISGRRMHTTDIDVAFDVSLVGNEVSALTEIGGRKILKPDDGINTTITFGEQLWYVLMGEYNFNHTVDHKEPLEM